MPVTTIKRFFQDEDGAVTVDWVVLTAAVVGLGIAVVASVRDGAADTASGVSASLANATLRTIKF